jgi:hypothetical protein
MTDIRISPYKLKLSAISIEPNMQCMHKMFRATGDGRGIQEFGLRPPGVSRRNPNPTADG